MRKLSPRRPPSRLVAPHLMFSVILIVTAAFAYTAKMPRLVGTVPDTPAAPVATDAPTTTAEPGASAVPDELAAPIESDAPDAIAAPAEPDAPSKQFLPDGYIGFALRPTATPTTGPTATPTQTWTPLPPTATPTLAPTATPTVGLATATPTPPPAAGIEFTKGLVQSCAPNAGVTYAEGTVYRNHQPANGVRVVFSWMPDGPWVTQPAISGPHDGYPNWNPGFWSHLIGVGGPRAGDWHFWLVNEAGQRISVTVYLHTDGEAGPGKCQQAVIDFDTN